MSFNFSPKIVQDGLILCLDAANPKSYLGSGTLWNDLTENKNLGTLTNGPTFDGNNAGSIVFDGVDDYAVLSNTIDIGITGTWSVWMNGTAYNSTSVTLGSDTASNVYTMHYDGTAFWINYGGISGSTTYLISTNLWYNVTYTRNSDNHEVFVDGVSVGTMNLPSSPASTIFKLIANEQIGTYPFNGKIATHYIYDRVLSQTEILQNYNALRSRFGK